MDVRPYPDITENAYNELKRLPGNDFAASYDELLELNAQLKRSYGDQAKAIKVYPREFIAYCEKSRSSIDGRAHYTWASLHRFLTCCWATLEKQSKANQFEDGDSFDDN
jgi:hypothetical protein